MTDVVDSQTGITIVLTPVQLAALLQDVPLTRMETASNRLFGAISILGGAVDLVASVPLWLAPEPTLSTKVVAGGLDDVGTDMVVTSTRQIWTGRSTKSLTNEVIMRSLQSLGVEPEVADRLGSQSDLALGLAATIATPTGIAKTLGAARVLSVERRLINLEVEEAAGGTQSPNTSEKLRPSCALDLRLSHGSQRRHLFRRSKTLKKPSAKRSQPIPRPCRRGRHRLGLVRPVLGLSI